MTRENAFTLSQVRGLEIQTRPLPELPAGSKVVCILTGNGLKDPDTAIREAHIPRVVDATLNSGLASLTL